MKKIRITESQLKKLITDMMEDDKSEGLKESKNTTPKGNKTVKLKRSELQEIVQEVVRKNRKD